MEKVFYPTKYGLQSRFKLAVNTPEPIVRWVDAQPRAVYGIERKSARLMDWKLLSASGEGASSFPGAGSWV